MLRQSLTMLPAQRKLYQAKLGMYLFLAGLVLIFFTALLGYSVVRRIASVPGAELTLPSAFLPGLAGLVAISGGLHWAVHAVHRERVNDFRLGLAAAWLGALVFFTSQVYGMEALLEEHWRSSEREIRVFGFAFFLAALHAAHVVGGLGLLIWVTVQAIRGCYDHEYHWPVDICGTYWHFLDVIWIVMLATFWIVR
ncbi:MAG: cytochrome c oxidase subunit 3 [Pirellulaceae bacterium]|nr:cytochrome c oxidase subunit 3 [Planctomycetales bacterium]